MKKILLILLFSFAFNFVFAQQAFFDRYNDKEGVSTIYISATMLKMMGNVQAGNKDITRIAKRLDHIQVLHCERPSLVNSIRNAAFAYYKQAKYIVVMKTKNNGDDVTIYEKKYKNGKNEYVLLTVERGEFTIVNLLGRVSLEEIQAIAKWFVFILFHNFKVFLIYQFMPYKKTDISPECDRHLKRTRQTSKTNVTDI